MKKHSPYAGLPLSAALKLASACSILASPLAAVAYEGYGAVTAGGAGGQTYHVTSLADTGPGTLRDAIVNRSYATGGPRTVVFDVAGTINLASDIYVREPFLTIDGSTAPSPGITIRPASLGVGAFSICGTHDIILTHLRFYGLWQAGGTHCNCGILGIDGDSSPDHSARNMILDHLTVRNSTDSGPDIWGQCSDITISWCHVLYSWHPTTVSHYPAPFQTRDRISLHHNVYAKNGERNPQLRADTRNFNMVNNVFYDWGFFGENSGCGTRIRNDSGEPKVSANIINNYWLPTILPEYSLVYGLDPGADATEGRPAGTTPAQGTVLTNTLMGQLYVAGNQLPPQNMDQYSTIAAPLAVPSSAQVTTWSADQLKANVLPQVGWKFRTADEQAVLDELSSKMIGAAPQTLKCDYNGDGKVDSTDTEHFAACITGPMVVQSNPYCRDADLDGDGDVDQSDFGLLQRCMSDANASAPAECLK